jgi:hypothetical protein
MDAHKSEKAVAKIDKELKRLELFDNVQIETTANGEQTDENQFRLRVYEKDADRFELKNGVNIVTVEDSKPTNIRARQCRLRAGERENFSKRRGRNHAGRGLHQRR